MAVTRQDYSNNVLAVAFTGLPPRRRDQLSCIHSVQVKKLARWIEQLNILNLEQCIPVLSRVLNELVDLAVGPEDIFKLYAVLRPCINRVQSAAHAIYSRKRLHLTHEVRQALEASHSLDVAEVKVLSALLPDLAPKAGDTKTQQMIAAVGCFILLHYHQITLRLNEFGLEAPKDFWRQCHSVFWLLRTCNCDHIKQEQNFFSDYPRTVSFNYLYKSLILNAIIEPERFDRALQEDLQLLMLEFAKEVEIVTQPNAKSIHGIFLTEDVSHVPIKVLEEVEQAQKMYLEFEVLLEKFNKGTLVSKVLSSNKRVEALVSELKEAFSAERFRCEYRAPAQEKVEAYFGLLQIHKVLSGNRGGKHAFAEEIDYGQAQSGSIKSESLLMQNQSSGGFCFESQSKHKIFYEPGDLVYFELNHVEILGVIKWKRLKASGEHLFGFENLGKDAEPVVFSIQLNEGVSDQEKGIWYAHDEHRFLLSRLNLIEEQVLTIFCFGEVSRFKVIDLHWLVSGYVRSLIEPMR